MSESERESARESLLGRHARVCRLHLLSLSSLDCAYEIPDLRLTPWPCLTRSPSTADSTAASTAGASSSSDSPKTPPGSEETAEGVGFGGNAFRARRLEFVEGTAMLQ